MAASPSKRGRTISAAQPHSASDAFLADGDMKGQRDPITLTRFILQEQSKHPTAQGDLTILLQSIQLACKVISNACRKAGIAGVHGLAGETNSSGDSQKKLDVFSNDVFVNCLRFSEKVGVMVSEEDEKVIVVPTENAKYAAVFDPLDGSSNIDANVSVGTIFGIFAIDECDPKDVLKPGRNLVAAGYGLYGAATMLVLSTGLNSGLHGFTLDASLGEFILTHQNIRIPDAGKIYSINEGNSQFWDEPTKEYIHNCKFPKKGSPKSLRYVGSMVADVHRTLLYGGIFCYPGDSKSATGKLRLLYEGGPMAFIMEAAGGSSTTGLQNVLDVVPKKLHEKVPVFLGSKTDVAEVEALYKKHAGQKK